MNIRSIIIDDEKKSREALEEKIKKFCPDVEIVATAENAQQGMEAISKLQPELVFLDIEMPVTNGFSMLEKINALNFEVIFTTAYDQYAIKAIRFSALDYLLKPIDAEELQKAIEQYKKKKEKPGPLHPLEQFRFLMESMKTANDPFNKLALPTSDGFHMVYIKDIIRLQSDSNYTTFYLQGGKSLVVSKTMKEYEEMLEEYHFFRVHNSHIINLHLMNKYIKGEGGYVIMEDGSSIEVSTRRKQAFLQKLAK